MYDTENENSFVIELIKDVVRKSSHGVATPIVGGHHPRLREISDPRKRFLDLESKILAQSLLLPFVEARGGAYIASKLR